MESAKIPLTSKRQAVEVKASPGLETTSYGKVRFLAQRGLTHLPGRGVLPYGFLPRGLETIRQYITPGQMGKPALGEKTYLSIGRRFEAWGGFNLHRLRF